MRTGKEYLEALRDDRTVYVNGEEVDDVTSHPAFEGVSRTIASMYDFAANPDNGMIFESPETGNAANKVFRIPRTREELADRREAITKWARFSRGFLGRSPDHVGGFLAGFASAPDVFNRGEGRQYGDNVVSFYKKVLDEDLFVTYVIIPPQVSRATTAHGWEGEFIQVGVVEERDDGMLVRGAQMLGTGTTVSDYLYVSCIKPLPPEDKEHALSFVVPVDAPGLKLYSRRPYAMDQPSTFDYPMSTRFDETDSLVVFDDVLVPWENVFIVRDTKGLQAQYHATAAHVLGNTQAQIRLVEKMKFIIGIARRIAQVNEIDGIPGVQEKLGDLASLAAIVEGMVLASEYSAAEDDHGVMQPNPRFMYGAMGLQAETYPRALSLLRELAGGGVIQVPSSYKELVNDETRPDMERYVQSPGTPSVERVKLFKLAWDVVGSEFGGRHHQYEMFYAGAPFVAKGYAYRNYGYDEVVEDVNEFLDSYDLDTADN